ncbi:hypothetical protein B6I21_07770 [candidate division KSB1 bacterium 4572_119]|nr:MAG: hypothetical protein B6I21_07770 [candidate division KSB1 bacterium 4572_119]
MKKLQIILSILIIFALSIISCEKDSGTEPNNIIATEKWEHIADEGLGSGNWTFEKMEDNSITVDGTWLYSYSSFGATLEVTCPFSDGTVTVSEANMSFTASGTATIPNFGSSPFDLAVTGTCSNGEGEGTYIITFSTEGWPDKIEGNWTGSRSSGSGITQ